MVSLAVRDLRHADVVVDGQFLAVFARLAVAGVVVVCGARFLHRPAPVTLRVVLDQDVSVSTHFAVFGGELLCAVRHLRHANL